MQEAERGPMKKDWEIYRDTGILGGYMPECAKLRQTEDGDVATVFRDTTTCMEEDCITKQREMLIGSRRFCISGRTFRNADGQADCLHRRGTGKGSAQRIKFS